MAMLGFYLELFWFYIAGSPFFFSFFASASAGFLLEGVDFLGPCTWLECKYFRTWTGHGSDF